jgi:tetratricopeptide (TPR) repeat protein
MKKQVYIYYFIGLIVATLLSILFIRQALDSRMDRRISEYSGSESCRPCHEKFYQLWANSYHGLAMQPVTADFISLNLTSIDTTINFGDNSFQVVVEKDSLAFIEKKIHQSPSVYSAAHVMGGKYVYYFLTELDRGKLQVLPVAYDVKTQSWYNNPESGVRHFETDEDSPLEWTSHLYTFNTSCYSCHVSQLNTNFDTTLLSYNTEWREPGINCETCHGPSAEHIKACVSAGEGNIPEDLKIIVTSSFNSRQHNSSCGSCHSKGSVISASFIPGEEFFDHFDLITLENPDFYPDGRDLGENYTMSSWAMNRCAASSDINCLTCHTSSGRYIFTGDNRNGSCLPCHKEKVDNPEAHTAHSAESDGSVCISCHMPKTTFGRMDRSDHSFRPPMPAASIQFGSPNACTICHTNRSDEWADNEIRRTHLRDHQYATIRAGELVIATREQRWESVNEISSGLIEGLYDEIYTVSFIRLIENIGNPVKWPALLKMTNHQSPLVRSAAAHSLATYQTRETFNTLVYLANDSIRLVRLNAAWALSSFPDEFISPSNKSFIEDAISEYISSQLNRPDDWGSSYNLGNFFRNRGNYTAALHHYSNSIRIFPGAIMSHVNSGYLYAMDGDYKSAERSLQDALAIDPQSEAALLNLALLYGETGESVKAQAYYRKLLDISERNSVAAYNLSILVFDENPGEAIRLSQMAAEWDNGNSKYLYTTAFYLSRMGDSARALEILFRAIEKDPDYADSYLLAANISIEKGDTSIAHNLLNRVLENRVISQEDKKKALTLIGKI